MATRRVVTIATADGAHAEETGRLVAERLGYRHVNEAIIERAAALAGVSPAEVAALEKPRALVDRILGSLARATMIDPTYGVITPDLEGDEADLRRMIRAAIEAVAAEGEAVIVAHGAAMQLGGQPEVLRVFVTASPEVRACRIAHAAGGSLEAARKAVERADRARAGYFRGFYQLASEQPHHYDLVLSTDGLTPEQAATVIAAAAAA